MAKITKAEMPALAEQIVKCLGGKENVARINHCATRLRENVNSKCEKNIKKYNQASRADSSRHSANTISAVFQPNISRG